MSMYNICEGVYVRMQICLCVRNFQVKKKRNVVKLLCQISHKKRTFYNPLGRMRIYIPLL